MNGISVVECRGVRKRYGRQFALLDLDLDVWEGEIFGFLGPNGAGKTTLIRILLGLAAPTAGQIRLFGQDLFTEGDRARRRIGAIVESPSFFEYMSGWDNLRYLVRLSGPIPDARLREALALVGLAEAAGKRVGAYSLGMKQRLGIAQALLPDTRFLILDEPANGLDPHGIAGIRDLIRSLARDHGLTVFLSSHLLAEVEQVCDRIAIVNRGRKILEGRVDQLRADGCRVRVRVRATPEAAERLRALGLEPEPAEDDAVCASCRLGDEALPDLVRKLVAAGLDVLELRPAARTLEEVFLEHTLADGVGDARVDSIRAS